MSKDVVISVVRDSFQELRTFLENAESLEKSLKRGPLPKSKRKSLLKKSQRFVDGLYILSDEIKSKFYEHYNKEGNCKNNGSKNDRESSPTQNNHEVTLKTTSENDGSQSVVDESAESVDVFNDTTLPLDNLAESHGREKSTPIEDNAENSTSDKAPKNDETINNNKKKKSAPNQDELNTDTAENSTSEEASKNDDREKSPPNQDKLNTDTSEEASKNDDREKSPPNQDKLNTDTAENSNSDKASNDEVTNGETNKTDEVLNADQIAESDIKQEHKMIRLVDLSKLLEPKQKKSVKFDSSVIILTSSDEENENVTPKRIKGTELKSALKNSTEKHVSNLKNNQLENNKDDDSSNNQEEDDSANNSRKSSRLRNIQVNKETRKDELKKIFKRSSEKNFEIISKKSKKSDSSNKSKVSVSEKDTVSITSDDSDTEMKTANARSNLRRKCKTDVTVPLPLVNCEKLKEVCEKDENFFVRSTRSNKRIRTACGSDSDSSISKIKKSKANENPKENNLIADVSDKTEKSDSGDNKETKDTGKKSKASTDDYSSDDYVKTGKDISDSSCDEDEKKKRTHQGNTKTKKTNDSDHSSVEGSESELTTKKDKSKAKNSSKSSEKKDKKLPKKDVDDKQASKVDSDSDNDSSTKSKNKGKSKERPVKKANQIISSDSEDEIVKTDKSDGSHSEKGSDSEGEKKQQKGKKELDNKNQDEEIKSDISDIKKISDSEEEEEQQKGKTKAPIKKTKKNHNIVLSDSEEDKPKNDDSDISDDEGSDSEGKNQKNKKQMKKKKLKIVLSDSDEEENGKKDSGTEKSDSSDEDKKNSDSEEEKPKPKKKSRIKKTNDSSSSDSEEKTTRKKLRKVLDKNSLSETTKKAEVEERERKARIAEKQKKYNRIFEEKKDAVVESVVLDYNEKTKEPVLSVHKSIVKNLKPHQVSGIQFMYDACYESTEQTLKGPGSGCILAHCMGLGKTLQVISLVHTLLKNSSKTKVEKVMVVCPINTVLNWKAEFKKWVPKKSSVEVYELATAKKNYERQYKVQEWHEDGGVLIIGYNMFRLLSNPQNKKISKKMRESFSTGLVDPGPDLVICDEGHLLKNEKTNLSIAMNRIKTARRIVLTGTPLQNNLKEYWCMVQFIKPNLLGSYKEYMNRFVNPITNGQYTDSTSHDILLMRKRSHVLHKLLDGVVQRRDYAVLEPYLPPKQEYVIFIQLSEVQVKLYRHYMDKLARKNDGSTKTSFLFTDFQNLQRICTHPRVLLDKSTEKREKWSDEDESEGSLKDFIDDREESASSSSSSSKSGSDSEADSDSGKKKTNKKTRVTRALAAQRKENNEDGSDLEIVEEVKKEWWQEYCDGEELDNIKNSAKMTLLFETLKECEEIGDKLLVFSQSLYTLNCIEYFLNKVDEATSNGNPESVGGYTGTWELGLDYFRLDGSSSCDNRAYWCDSFNSPDNIRARLFLISTRAGGLGINLVAANRVIIFDVSWNPSHDIQSIYRVYRFGQTKPCYIYRFVTYGAMEMKIYERQVTKQAISKRVIDEQQIDRHYNQNDLQELYKCDLEPQERPIPMVPKDVLFGEMLQKHEKVIYKYHIHQSLLENKQDECLNEDERKAAWDEFENEKVLRRTTSASQMYPDPTNMSAQAINMALTNIVKRDNPNWSEVQIKGIIPALVRQLQIQIKEGDMSMYQRVVQEIQIINQAKLKESYYQQQMMKYYQQQLMIQQQQQQMMGNLNISPHHLTNLLGVTPNIMTNAQPFANGPSTSQRRLPNDSVIDLND